MDFCSDSGFTHWSSSRQPVQVFLLLETLYGAFDEVADRRKVFKIETIGRTSFAKFSVAIDGENSPLRFYRSGDCYVAVTGECYCSD